MNRSAEMERNTTETKIRATLDVDGTGVARIDTGVGFLNHLLEALVKHSRLDVVLSCAGDLEVDDHHTVEDVAIVLGRMLTDALGDRRGINRYGYAYAPLDEALVRAVIDLSGRPFAKVRLNLNRERLGDLSCENIPHFLESMSVAAGMTLHVETLSGRNDHHKAEAAFKAVALALRQAVGRSGFDDLPSTKGVLDTGR